MYFTKSLAHLNYTIGLGLTLWSSYNDLRFYHYNFTNINKIKLVNFTQTLFL